MDYSAANHTLWNIIIQLGLIAGSILLANFLRQKLRFVRQSLMPVAVLAGFLLLILKYAGPTMRSWRFWSITGSRWALLP